MDTGEVKCDHKGHFRSAGVVPAQTPNGTAFFLIMYCDDCGSSFVRVLEQKVDSGINKSIPMSPQQMRDFMSKIKK